LNSLSWVSIGLPAPQGSKKHVGRGIMIESSKFLPAWREQMIFDLMKASDGKCFDSGQMITLTFRFPRLKSHYNSKGLLKPNAPTFKITNPDIDKLCRAVLDAATISGVIRDDAQCAMLTAVKVYCNEGEQPGVSGTISAISS